MFGYVKPDMPNLYMKDSVLYRAVYCGVCKSIADKCGTVSRMALSYDMAFLSAFFHNIMNTDVEISDERCILHPILKRPIAARDSISEAAAFLNVFFTYYKLTDDINDLKRGRLKRSFFKPGYKKAARENPELDIIVKSRYAELLVLEKDNCDGIDQAAEPFGRMIEDISVFVLKEFSTEHTKNVCFNLGKFVYLIDALDDYDKDIKKNNYNVFYNSYQNGSFNELTEQHREDLEFVFGRVFEEINKSLDQIKFYFNHDLTDNILTKGLPQITKKILNKEKKKCKKTRMKF